MVLSKIINEASFSSIIKNLVLNEVSSLHCLSEMRGFGTGSGLPIGAGLLAYAE